MTTCPECGTQLAKGARFCHNCGWDSKLAAAGKGAQASGPKRPAWKRITMGITLALAAILMMGVMVVPRGDTFVTLTPGEVAPDFTLTSMDGEVVRLSDLSGQPVVLNFWASWCPPCRKEMPEFQAVYERYEEAGLKMYGINVGESEIAVRNFIEPLGVTFPQLRDIHEEAQTDYRILPLPTTFFIGRDGVIKAVYQWQISEAQLDFEVVKLLSGR